MEFIFKKSEAPVGNGNYELLPEGKYEVIITSAKRTESKFGTEYISIDTTIEETEKYAKRHIFLNLFKKKEPDEDDMCTDGYSFKQIMMLCDACRFNDGTHFNNLDEFLKLLPNRHILVTLKHNTYNGTTREKVTWAEPPKAKVIDSNPSDIANEIGSLNDFEEIISDDEIPF